MVQAIPAGVGSVVPYLCVRGARKAVDFYREAFGAELVSMMPMSEDLVGHADLKIGTSRLYLADEMPGWGAVKSPAQLKGTSVNVHLWVEDCDAAFARAVGAGAKVLMPLMDQFWGDRYGMVGDPFGHVWAISSHKEDLTPEEVTRRGAEAMAQMAAQAPPKAKAVTKTAEKAVKKAAPSKAPSAPAGSKTSKSEKAEARNPKKTKKAKKAKAKLEKKAKHEKKSKSKKDKKRKKKSKR